MSTADLEITLVDQTELVIAEEPKLTAEEQAAQVDEAMITPHAVVAVNFYDDRGRTNKKTALGVVEKDNEDSSFTVRLIYPTNLNNVTIGVRRSDLMPLYNRAANSEIDDRQLLGALLLLARRLDKRNNKIDDLSGELSRRGR